MSRAVLLGVVVVILAVLIVGGASFYTVNQTEEALVTQFGAPQAVVTDPGLHFKTPFLQQVHYFDKRLLNIDGAAEEVIAQDKKRMVVDAFARWRIVDPLRFYQTLGDQQTAYMRLTPILSSDVRRVLGAQNFSAVLSQKRAQLMIDIRNDMNQDSAGFGIKVDDVRIRHADLPQQNSDAIYSRMIQERKREALEYRAEGEEISQRIKARAQREVTVLTAEATRESEIQRGQGDAQKTRILADAYGQDADFFAFYRSMQAYKQALGSDTTTMVLSPNSEFFRYFGQTGNSAAAPSGKRR
ncbi:MAG: protease modulator HflC [Rhizomicrobium sp.]|jgi:membrane protease subunit HflC